MSFPSNAQAYAQGTGLSKIGVPYITNRAPTNRDTNFTVGQVWIHQGPEDTYQLNSFSTLGGTLLATWQRTASGTGGAVYTITGDSGGAIASDSSGNFIVLGNGAGISFSGSGSTLTATISGGGFNVVSVTTTTQTLAANTLYIVNNAASLVTFTLPAIAVLGDTYIIHGKTALGWRVNVTTGQTLHLGNLATTASTGYIASTDQWDSVTITCVTANTTFATRSVQGVLTAA